MRVRASAPGKLMLYGEHAVVHNHPCLVTAVDIRTTVTASVLEAPVIRISTPELRAENKTYQISVDEIFERKQREKKTKFVELALFQLFSNYSVRTGLEITTAGLERTYGLGTSSAATVASIGSVAQLLGIKLTQREVFELAYAASLEAQNGKGSGFDVASAVYGGTLHFFTGGEFIDPLSVDALSLVIGYSGSKVGTVSMIDQVDNLSQQQPQLVSSLYDTIEHIVSTAKTALIDRNWQLAGKLADLNQSVLSYLDVSTKNLDIMIEVARKSGAYGAKLSGAGGGDCMFAIVPPEKRQIISEELKKLGDTLDADIKVVDVKLNADGLRID